MLDVIRYIKETARGCGKYCAVAAVPIRSREKMKMRNQKNKQTEAAKGRKSIWRSGSYYIVMAGLMMIFLGSGSLLMKNLLEDRKHEQDLDRLSSLFREPAEAEPGVSPGVEGQPGEELQQDDAEARFRVYQSLKEQNQDFVGWIRIDGTRIDYPVVQTPDRPDYYLHRDFNGESSKYGTPYMAESCRYEEPGTSLLIYGHHMKNGEMFADLQNYTEAEFYRQHPYIRFDTVDRIGNYEVVATVKVDASGDATPWQELLFPEDEETFDAAWKEFQRQSFYWTEASAGYEDRLLALVTCEYTLKDGRLMVVTKEIR